MYYLLIALSAMLGAAWAPTLVWYWSLPWHIRVNLPPRGRPWWLP
jgi:hypothetical protein